MKGWGWQSVHDPELLPGVIEKWKASLSSGDPFEMEFPLRGADGKFRWFLTRVNPVRNAEGQIIRWFGTNTDVDDVRQAREALKEESRVLELLNTTGSKISSQLNLQDLVQSVTDAGTELSGAKFGAFFYNVIKAGGESLLLYTLSGAPREAFAKFGLPRATPVFHPTLSGQGIVRSADITQDSRYGKMPPHHGMPKGHLPVRSYLAVPVTSRSGEVIGGLFFGHPEPNIFTERSEKLIVGIAAQAAIAIDNARLYEKAQKEIAERERLTTVLERSLNEIYIFDTETFHFSYVNDGARRNLGYSQDEMRKLTPLDLKPDFTEARFREMVKPLLSGDKQKHLFYTKHRRRNGSLYPVEVHLQIVSHAEQKFFVAVILDITERKKLEEARFQLAAVVESSADAIMSKTLDRTITTWNGGAARMYGYEPHEIIGQSVTVLIPPNRIDEGPFIIERLKKGERIEHYETVQLLKNGTLLDVSLTVSPIKDADGKIIGVSKIARDITERKRSERELQKAKDELEVRVVERTASLRETTEQLETFCYTIAHDLRSPLRAQQSFAQSLIDEYKDALDETGRHYAQRIINSAQRLDKLVNDLLTYSRLTRSELKFDMIDLNRLVRDVQTSLTEEIRLPKATISIGELQSVCAYEPTLNLIIFNLITNALKFIKPDQTPQVKIWSERREERVRLWVEDNGIGISPENIDKIFGVFQRLHSMDKYPGTGIGLAIVQKGIERMGGTVGVESKLGEGSRFWIELPATC